MNRKHNAPTHLSPALTGGNDEDWRTQGLCAQTNPEQWFPQKGGEGRVSSVVARETCLACPVIAECFADVLENTPEFGIFAGLDVREIRAAKARKAAKKKAAAA